MDELQYNRHVGSRIKEMRKSRKMTLKELGEHIGLSESNTKRYEDGQIKTVGIDIIKKLQWHWMYLHRISQDGKIFLNIKNSQIMCRLQGKNPPFGRNCRRRTYLCR